MSKKKECANSLIVIVISIVCCLWGALGISTPVCGAAVAKEKVKVAYFETGEYYNEAEDGTIDSYDTEYLKRISDYSGLEFEYVDCGTWVNALAMLNNHEVDLVGTMQWSKEREEQYDICLEGYGYTIGEVAVLPDQECTYEDYDKIGQSVIGCTEDYVQMDEMKKDFEEQNIAPTIRTYANEQELQNALLAGEIDMIAANSHTLHAEWKVVEKFSYAPFYFASWKGNDALVKQIDDAIIQINMYDSEFDDELIQRYFPLLVGVPFTKEEYDLIDEKNVYTIYFDGQTKPIAWYDETTDSMQGIIVEICKQLEQETGLILKPKLRTDQTSEEDSSTVQYCTLYYDEDTMEQKDAGITDSIQDETFNFYHRMGEPYSVSGNYTIAMVKNRSGLKKYLEESYPQCNIVEYSDPEECVKHVVAKDADVTFLNTHVADNILITDDIDNVLEIPLDAKQFGIALQFSGEDKELLADIVNKGMKMVDVQEINDITLQYALDTTPKMTVPYFIRRHPVISVVILAMVTLVLIALASFYTYAKVMKKEKNRVEVADRARADFFARMSHDMRTPMNGILGMIELTQQTDDMAEVQSNMVKAKSAGRYMLSLINDTLDLQRLENGRLKFDEQTVYMEDFINNLHEMFRMSFENKGIEFQVDNSKINLKQYVCMDPIRIKQIFVNLLSNAGKFTPEGGTIAVRNECLSNKDGLICVKTTIKDSGIGMSKEFMERELFKAYSQEKNKMSGQYAGSGLGLAITKNLVDLMGGKIEVESELGEGTVFYVYLNIKLVDEQQAVFSIKKENMRNSKVQTQLAGAHVLVCEDHPLNAEIAMRLLEKVGCKVTWAENGKQGLNLFLASECGYYDVIMMDIRMPVLDGIEATREIRSLEREDAKTVPIIAMTANAYDSDMNQSKEAGMNEHLAKPIEPQKLYETLSKYIQR